VCGITVVPEAVTAGSPPAGIGGGTAITAPHVSQ
jgi:hypothetical protein